MMLSKCLASLILFSCSRHAMAFSFVAQVNMSPRRSTAFCSRSFQLHTSSPEHTNNEWELEDEELEILFEENGLEYPPKKKKKEQLDEMEMAWRHAEKPLLRIGSKGATLTHGNSLRQLLDAHTVVKVKMNTRKFGTLEDGFQVLKKLAEDSGAAPGIELVQFREGESTIMCGLPGTLEKIRCGEFPPPANGEAEDEEKAP